MSRRRWWTVVGAITVVALGVRVVWVLWVTREPSGLVDSVRYLGYARQIADGKGMVDIFTAEPTAYYPPGYPWFLGIVAWLSRPFTDNLPLTAALVQAALGAATATLGALVARRLAGARAGIAAALGLALYPNLVFHSGAILGETLYGFLFMAFLVTVLARPWNAGLGARWIVGSGVLLGLAVLVRPISLAVVPIVFLAWWIARADAGSALRWSALLVIGLAAAVLPWTVRNEVRLGHVVPISTNTGDNLCIGHGPGATGAFTFRRDCEVKPTILEGPDGEVAADTAKLHAAFRGIAERPGREPWLLWSRFYYTWVRDGDHDGVLAVQSYRLDRFLSRSTEERLTRTADIIYLFTCAAGLVGLVVLVRRRRPDDILVVGSAIMTALVPLAFFGDSRFKVPVMPLLIVIAASGLTSLARDRRRSAEAPPDAATPMSKQEATS